MARIGVFCFPGTLRKLDDRLGELHGLAGFGITVERARNTALMVLRDGPDAVRRADLDALIVDEADMGGTVATAWYQEIRNPMNHTVLFSV